MAAKTDAITYSKDFLKACKALPVKIDKAILFGSAAQDKATADSDIDLALFSTGFSSNILNNLDLIARVLIRFPNLDVHTFPLRKPHKKNSLIEEEIEQTGIVLTI